MKKHLSALLILSAVFLTAELFAGCKTALKSENVEVFCGTAVKPVMDELVKRFESETDNRVLVRYAASGVALSQMELSRRGDVFVAGSPDFMDKAVQKHLVRPGVEQTLAYLVPALVVPKYNPKKILRLSDLLRPDVTVGLANPKTVCVGTYAVEILEANRLLSAVKRRVKVYAESCSAAAAMVAMKKVDVVIGWREFGCLAPGAVEVIPLQPEEIPRIAYIPAAPTVNAKRPADAEAFVRFLASDRSRAVFEKHGYITRRDVALRLAPKARVGGEYRIPALMRE